MIYKDFKNKKLSALGMGCMRLPISGNSIDIEETRKMIDYALKNGINYFDTAWGYHDGKSETVIGEILKNYPRDSFYLADKFPGYDLDNFDKAEEIFEEQLKKCQVDHFDFYLLHCVTHDNIEHYLNPKYGVVDYLVKQKQNGRIKHLGFSAHADITTMKRFLDAYSENIEFCQLQINWLDWEFQNAKEKVNLMHSYNIPVWVMEPVRGGSLANILPQFDKKLKSLNPQMPTVEWAFRFLQTIPDVTVTLSGMSSFEQIKQNIEIYTTNSPLTQDWVQELLKIGKVIANKNTVQCTACRYCTSYCSAGLDIPRLIEIYNEQIYSGNKTNLNSELSSLQSGKLPSDCLGCRACEKVCPQNIKISEIMNKFS